MNINLKLAEQNILWAEGAALDGAETTPGGFAAIALVEATLALANEQARANDIAQLRLLTDLAYHGYYAGDETLKGFVARIVKNLEGSAL